MKIGITGGTGFIGSEVGSQALDRGHDVVVFTRSPETLDSARVEIREFSTGAVVDLSGLDAIVHLAGEPIIGWWTPPKKRRILESRVEGTKRIADAISDSPDGPRIFICGSGIDYYGDTGEQAVDESAPAGGGFLAEVAAAWEAAAKTTGDMRTVFVRAGLVLGKNGGAMKLMAPVFRAGLGGKLGSGRQWMSCIHVRDVAGLILHAIESAALSGPVNAVMPEPVRNADFTRAVAAAAHRPAFLPAPSLALKVGLGELSHLLLDSHRVVPKAAVESGYAFQFGTAEAALRDVFGPS